MATEPTSGGMLRRHRTAALVSAGVLVALFGLTPLYAAVTPDGHVSSARIVFGKPQAAAALAAYVHIAPAAVLTVGAASRLEANIPDRASLLSAAAAVRASVTVSTDPARDAIVVDARDNRMGPAGRTARAYAGSLLSVLGATATRERARLDVPSTGSRPLVTIAIAVVILALLTIALLLARRAKP
jgi:hypothetical protein